MCSWASIGLPAATRPTTGSPTGAAPKMRMARERCGEISMAPLRRSAFRCSSAAFGDLKPNSRAMSARVGG